MTTGAGDIGSEMRVGPDHVNFFYEAPREAKESLLSDSGMIGMREMVVLLKPGTAEC